MTGAEQNAGALLPKVGSYESVVEPFHCDFRGRYFMGHLGNALLNAADFHSNERSYGMHYLHTIHRTWVLSRLAVELEQTPNAYDPITVDTWVEAAVRYFTSRNFAIRSADGAVVYGYGRSTWAMIDTETRQPVNILEVRDGLIASYIETDKPCPIEKSGRVTMDKEVPLVRTIETHYHDVDVNGHVNSVKYIEHVLDLFDIEWYRSHRLKRFEIAYVAESHGGDRLNLYLQQNSELEYAVRITKDGEEDVEVVRCLLIFAKD